jgi:APA family basic amino acid/polyamine antiporter
MAKIAVPADAPKGDGLLRELNLFGAVSMIVGIVIGSGIFLSVNRVAQGTGSPFMIVVLWIVAGLMTLMGALCYAELGTIFPKAGGEYVFLKEGLGALAAFLSGWVAFTVNLAGSAAALAVIFSEQLFVLTPDPAPTILFDLPGSVFPPFTTSRLFAIALIAALSLINYYGVKYGGGVQMLFTVLKGALIVILAIAALVFLGNAATPEVGFFESAEYSINDCGSDGCVERAVSGFDFSMFAGVAMVGALFAYDGWTNVVRVGSELKNPGQNIPKAMIFGLGAVMVLYIATTLGYLNVLGYQGLADASVAGLNDNARTVATNTADVLTGGAGGTWVAVMILVSVFGALNGITLSGPRIYFAMSRDRIFPRIFEKLSKHHTPGWAILFQAILAGVFLLLFNFDELTDNVIFISFFFYGLAALGLLVLRRTHPDLHRPYKVPFYPYLPIAYVLVAWGFVAYLIYDQIVNFGGDNFNRIFSFLIVLAGLPVFFYYRRKARIRAEQEGLMPPPPLFGPDPNADARQLEDGEVV